MQARAAGSANLRWRAIRAWISRTLAQARPRSKPPATPSPTTT